MTLASLLQGELGAAGTPGLQAAGVPAPEGPQQQAELLFNLRRLLMLNALFQIPELPPPPPDGDGGRSVGIGGELPGGDLGLPPPAAPGGGGQDVNANAPPSQIAGPLGGGLLSALLMPILQQARQGGGMPGGAGGGSDPLFDLLLRGTTQRGLGSRRARSDARGRGGAGGSQEGEVSGTPIG